jgi:YbbR domain-containing protein
MQSENRNKITRFLRLMKAFLVSRDALIFLFFLICSSLFWFIITLDKTYEFNVNIPIEYINVPPEIEFTTELPDNFNVKLKDKGTSMITYHYKDFAPVIIDFNEYSVYSNSNLWSIQTNTLVEEDIKLQINQSTIILDYFPDEIVIEKKLLDSKKVPVKTIIDLNFKKQYFLCDDIITSPDSITLYGYKEILDTLNCIYTNEYISEELKDTLNATLSLNIPHHCKAKPNKVNVIAPVEFYTESDIDLSIRVKNLPENIVVKTIPEKLNVSFLVGLSRYKDIRPSDFILSIDYESLRQSNSNIEAVTLESFPTYIKQPFLKDNKVKWLIEFVEPK